MRARAGRAREVGRRHYMLCARIMHTKETLIGSDDLKASEWHNELIFQAKILI
jgi:hypothetical protein